MIYLGLDLGQSQDPSALAIVERLKPAHPHRNPPSWQLTYAAKPAKSAIDPEPLIVRHVERMELDTRYSDVAKRVAAVALSPLAQGRKTLAVDATGVGMPVVEMLLALQMGCEIRPVVITGGLGQSNTGPMWHVAKVDLLCGLREAVETGELRVPRGLQQVDRLVQELMSVKIGKRPSGQDRVGADGCGEHDDMVIALALASWAARAGRPGRQDRPGGKPWAPPPGNRLFW